MKYIVQVSVPTDVVVYAGDDTEALRLAIEQNFPSGNDRWQDAMNYPADFAEIVESDDNPLPPQYSRLGW